MIRMVQSKSASHAKAYFNDALAKSDYYASNQELAGYWQGRLAYRLGLQGETTKEAFYALCDNVHPGTGEPLTPRTKQERTTGYDINFHCPKSVSLLHAFAKDDHILKAFQEAVTDTMQVIEADSMTRIRQGGVYDERKTGELVWGHFTHQTARPVEGALPDPHLHSHCYVLNVTWDDQEQRMKAGQFREINRNMPFYQAQFHKIFADKLEALGYDIRATAKAFEIEGVPQRAIDLFSKRTDEIGRIAKEKGITDAEELGELGARTRARKQKGHSMTELKAAWFKQIQAQEAATSKELEKPVRFARKKAKPLLTASQCVDHAISHCFERASVMSENQLLQHALRHGIGFPVSAKEIIQEFRRDDRIIHIKEGLRVLCTTREVLAEEKHMVALAREGKGAIKPLYAECPELKATGQQANAIREVLTTRNRVSIVRGAAGAGKTTLMQEAVSLMEKAGKTVTVVAPSSKASRGVLRDEGFGSADTVARLLIDNEMQASLKGQVLWVDEAGLLGTKNMTALLRIAKEQNAQLILGGDTRQHASVERGDALRIINKVAGIRTAEVNKIYRQRREDYKAAVEDLSKGNVKEGFDKLDAMGAIKTIDPMNPNSAMVDAYMDAMKKGKSALLVSPTHAQGDEATAEIRKRLRAEGMIGKREKSVSRLRNVNMTEAEKADTRNLKPGYVLQFDQNAPGIKRGSTWMVEEAPDKSVYLVNAEGIIRSVPTDKSNRYTVFEHKEISLSKGDLVMMTRNGFDLNKRRLNSGDDLRVIAVTKGIVTLRNETSHTIYEIANNFCHLKHSYCVTSHASQGKTVDQVFIYQPAATFGATNAKQFYVSVSRGRDDVHVFTDDKEELLSYASELGDRQSALELVKQNSRHKDAIRNQEKEAEKNQEILKQEDHERFNR